MPVASGHHDIVNILGHFLYFFLFVYSYEHLAVPSPTHSNTHPSNTAKMHTREHKRQKSSPFIKMDPDCAVCSLPADAACGCEANGLDIAVKQAEQKVMGSIYSEIKLVLLLMSRDCLSNADKILPGNGRAVEHKTSYWSTFDS